MIKDTIFWFSFVGFPMIFRKNKFNLLKNFIKTNLTFALILEFIINAYNFSLFLEITILLVGIFLEFLRIQHPSRYTEFFQLLISSILILSGLKNIIFNYDTLFSLLTLKIFILPLALNTLNLPFVYLFFLVIGYESLFNRLKDKNIIIKRKAKIIILKKCHFSLKKVEHARNMGLYNLMSISTFEDIKRLEEVYSASL